MGIEEKQDWQRVGDLGGGYVEVHWTVQCAFLYVFTCNQMVHQRTARKLAEDNEEPELGHLLGDGLMRWSDCWLKG